MMTFRQGSYRRHTRVDVQTEVMHGHDFKRQPTKPRSFPAYVYVIVSLVVVIAVLLVAIAGLIAWSATKGTGGDPPISNKRDDDSKPGSVPTPKTTPSPTPSAFVAGLTSQLIGTWKWSPWSMSFSSDGTGIYYNDGKKCFDYRYDVTGDVLRLTEVETITCGISGEYRISISGDNMECVSIKTGYVTNWSRVR